MSQAWCVNFFFFFNKAGNFIADQAKKEEKSSKTARQDALFVPFYHSVSVYKPF
jgi:hypothetical protein